MGFDHPDRGCRSAIGRIHHKGLAVILQFGQPGSPEQGQRRDICHYESSRALISSR